MMGVLNGRRHKAALMVFLAIVLGHWVEHLVQCWQMYVLGWPMPQARGFLGQFWPWLVTSETLHYSYALVMMVGFILLRPGFSGRSRTWWTIAMWIQIYHHMEHLLLLVQATSGWRLGGMDMPMSLGQFLIPRMELHMLYNTIVFAPMVVAMVLHRRESRRGVGVCGCVVSA